MFRVTADLKNVTKVPKIEVELPMGSFDRPFQEKPRDFNETVVLKNGTRAIGREVQIVMLELGRLLQENPIAFHELVRKARDDKYQFTNYTGSDILGVLKNRGMVRSVDGCVHDSVRNILLSAVEGEGLDMVLSWPVAQGGSSTASAPRPGGM